MELVWNSSNALKDARLSEKIMTLLCVYIDVTVFVASLTNFYPAKKNTNFESGQYNNLKLNSRKISIDWIENSRHVSQLINFKHTITTDCFLLGHDNLKNI